MTKVDLEALDQELKQARERDRVSITLLTSLVRNLVRETRAARAVRAGMLDLLMHADGVRWDAEHGDAQDEADPADWWKNAPKEERLAIQMLRGALDRARKVLDAYDATVKP